MKKEQKIEILAPAGSYECFHAAIQAGADAVYAAGARFGARAYADNFSQDELLRAIREAHLHDRRFYLTVNTLLKDEELADLYDYLAPLYACGLDAVIVQDIGVFSFIRQHFPEMDLHASTQMTLTNSLGAKFLEQEGAARIVPSRELSLNEIRKIHQDTNLEIECFVHGALCYCYSGQCLLSSMIGGRSGNRGQCAQPCRLPYTADGKQKYYLSLKDICTLELIPDLIEAGIDSFKIEGRNKSEYYVAVAARAYRKAIDDYFDNPHTWTPDAYVAELATLQNRGYTLGFLDGNAGPEIHNYDISASSGSWRYAGLVQSQTKDSLIFEIKHKIEKGDVLEFLSPDQFEPISWTMTEFYDARNDAPLETISSGHLGQAIRIPMPAAVLEKLPVLTVARKKIV